MYLIHVLKTTGECLCFVLFLSTFIVNIYQNLLLNWNIRDYRVIGEFWYKLAIYCDILQYRFFNWQYIAIRLLAYCCSTKLSRNNENWVIACVSIQSVFAKINDISYNKAVFLNKARSVNTTYYMTCCVLSIQKWYWVLVISTYYELDLILMKQIRNQIRHACPLSNKTFA